MARNLATILSGLALLTTIAATIYLLNIDIYQGTETVYTESGYETIQVSKTLVEVNGRRVANMLVVVTLLSGLPLLIRFTLPPAQRLVTWLIALLLLAFSILGILSIGVAYMPSALLLLIAAVVTLFIRKENLKGERDGTV